jgi:DNA repair protein RadC
MNAIELPRIIVRVEGVCAESLPKVSRSSDVRRLLAEYYAGHDREEFVCLLMNPKNAVIGIHTVSIGTLTLSLVHPRETFKAAIVAGAHSIILAHNHPSGDPTPSQEDNALTARLVEVGKLVGIQVLDHVIIGQGRFYSYADQGRL